jgi:hypothetical protein
MQVLLTLLSQVILIKMEFPDETDWQKEAYRNGFTQNHNLSMSGGTSKATFFGSLSYLDF